MSIAETGEPARRRRGRPSVKAEGPHPVDVHVGSRVRLRRALMGMSQEKLGEAIGLTFQQVQKYERGANRVSCSMLWAIAAALDVPVSFFFDGLEGAPPPATADALAVPEDMRRRDLEVVRGLRLLTPAQYDGVYTMIKALATEARAAERRAAA